MSEMAKSARSAMHDKVKRLTTADPHQKVDASSWTPPEAENANIQTGERPISKRQFKRGGKVEGEFSQIRADRKMRKAGGMTANEYLNRNVKDANEERDGPKHVGGFKRGGHVEHSDAKEDRALVREMVEKKAIKPKERASGGKLDGELQGTRPEGGRLARKSGGRSGKGKMNVNIVIAAGGQKPDEQAMPPQMAPHPPMPMPTPPPQMAGPPPMAPGAGGSPPMMRKQGGRTMKIAEEMARAGGAGGGEGRLEKAKAYGLK